MFGTLAQRDCRMMVLGIAYLMLAAYVVECFAHAPLLDDLT